MSKGKNIVYVGHQVAGIAGALAGTVCVFVASIFVLLLAEPWFRWPRWHSSNVFLPLAEPVQGFALAQARKGRFGVWLATPARA